MLARLLYPLNQRQQALVLTLMTVGGQSARDLLRHLPDDDQAALGEKMEKLLAIPSEKRVPLIVRQLKQLMAFRQSRGLEGVEPSWLIAGFRGESPRTVAIVLMHMPSSIARQVIDRLPAPVRDALPPRESLQDVPLELVKLVRARFDQKFAQMPTQTDAQVLGFPQIPLLSARELVTVIRQLGADELACAFVAAGKRALAEFLRRLPPESAEELIAAVKRVAREDTMDLKAAQAFLAKVLGNFANTDELFQKAGLYRLARAMFGQDATLIRQFQQRFPRAHGRLLKDYVERIETLEMDVDRDALARLRDQILGELAELSRRGKIDPRFGQVELTYETK